MASQEAITLKRAHAVLAIQKASSALAEKFNIDIPDLPNLQQHDSEFAHAAQLEHMGNVLTSLAVASKAAKDSDFKVDTDFVKEAAPPVPEKVEKVAEAIEETETPKKVKATKKRAKSKK
jgi:hypothetical protein